MKYLNIILHRQPERAAPVTCASGMRLAVCRLLRQHYYLLLLSFAHTKSAVAYIMLWRTRRCCYLYFINVNYQYHVKLKYSSVRA
jgi:hypothetical protein